MIRAPVSSSSRIPLPRIPDAHIVCNDRLDGVEPEEALSVDKDGTAPVEPGFDMILMPFALAWLDPVLSPWSI